MSGLFKPGSEIFHNTKLKIYPTGEQRITICSKPIFKLNEWEPVEYSEPVPKPKDMGGDVRMDSVRRAKQRIYDIAMCNDFTWLFTWTLSPELINRYDAKEVSRRLKNFLRWRVQKNDARYLVIPEHHKDGAIHIAWVAVWSVRDGR